MEKTRDFDIDRLHAVQLEILRDERFRQGDYYTDCLSGRGGA